MKRKDAIELIKFCGYHGDKARATRILIDARISMTAWQKAYRDGQRAKQLGIPCNCADCQKENQKGKSI